MPTLLKMALLIQMVLGILSAIILPQFESGLWIAVVPAVSLISVALVVTYWRRLDHADVVLESYSLGIGAVGMAFFLIRLCISPATLLDTEGFLLLVSSAASLLVWGTVQFPPSRSWYRMGEHERRLKF